MTLSLFRFQMLLHAPGVDIIFSEDWGKNELVIVGKEDERIYKRKQITDACDAAIEAKRQSVETETYLQQINKTLRTISGWRLTVELLEKVALALGCDVDILTDWRKKERKLQQQQWKQHKSRNLNQKTWLENLELLKSCIDAANGTFDYSSLDDEVGRRIATWVQRQRIQVGCRERNERSTITYERFKLMVDANFPFDTQAKPSTKKNDTKWLENLELLKSCIRDDGTFDYSSLDDEVRQRIMAWVLTQRVEVKRRGNNEHSTITDERYKLMLDANFPFDTRAKPSTKKNDTKWLENLELLKSCIRDDGTFDFSSLDDENEAKRLNNWAQTQRVAYRKRMANEGTCTMTDERYNLLFDAKFKFDMTKKPRPRKECASCEIELNEGNCSAAQLKKGSGKGKCKSCTKRGPAPGTSWKVA